MAIQLNATKGGFSINGGYLIVNMVQMQRYLKPVMLTKKETQPDGTVIDVSYPATESALQWQTRGQVYPSQKMREDSWGATDLNFAFSFDHVDGRDPMQEAYEFIKANGLIGWTLSGMIDV